jgi:hypothetical protein
MAVTRWRALEQYHPAVRLMVRYMWRQEPPLLPSGFADQMGLPRQLVSRWLQLSAPPIEPVEPTEPIEPTELVPGDMAESAEVATDHAAVLLPSLTPSLAVRLARAMEIAPREFLVAAGMCTDDDPLLTIEEAWAYIVARVAANLTRRAAGQALSLEGSESSDSGDSAGEAKEDMQSGLQAVFQVIEAARLSDLAHSAQQ